MNAGQPTSSAGTGADLNRDQLILDHLPLLHHIVGRLGFDSAGRIERDDLLGWGMLGLIGAADSWDPARGLQFSTFAYPRIRGAILDELRRMDFLPRGRRDKVRELERVVSELEQESGGSPSPEEIAARIGTSLEEVDEVMSSARLNSSVSLEDNSGALGALLSDPECDGPVDSVEWREMKALLVAAIQGLPEQEMNVITLYYAEELLLKEIGEVLGVSESRVSQIHSRALYRLNRELRSSMGRI
jgi:RNA polymerase sigma factor for flagellar operon FliA